MKNLKSISILALVLISLSACNNDDDVTTPVNEEEVITTVIVTLTGGGETITLQSKDLDGADGPNDPVVSVDGNLVAGTTYLGTTSFLNELANPMEDITEEVEEEGTDHQIFYQLGSTLGTITYDDVDANGNPIGIDFTLVAGTASTGDLIVTLKHLPNKAASGVTAGDITNAGGSTDALAIFRNIVVN